MNVSVEEQACARCIHSCSAPCFHLLSHSAIRGVYRACGESVCPCACVCARVRTVLVQAYCKWQAHSTQNTHAHASQEATKENGGCTPSSRTSDPVSKQRRDALLRKGLLLHRHTLLRLAEACLVHEEGRPRAEAARLRGGRADIAAQ